jgi:hypothetical protein
MPSLHQQLPRSPVYDIFRITPPCFSSRVKSPNQFITINQLLFPHGLNDAVKTIITISLDYDIDTSTTRSADACSRHFNTCADATPKRSNILGYSEAIDVQREKDETAMQNLFSKPGK